MSKLQHSLGTKFREAYEHNPDIFKTCYPLNDKTASRQFKRQVIKELSKQIFCKPNPSLAVWTERGLNGEPIHKSLQIGRFRDESHLQTEDYEARMKRLRDGLPGITDFEMTSRSIREIMKLK